MSCQQLKEDVIHLHEYAHLREDWVTPVEEVFEGLLMTEALWKPDEHAKCIFEIVLHLTVWTENARERIQSGEYSKPVEGAWPPLPNRMEEPDWDQVKIRLLQAIKDLQLTIENCSSGALLERSIGDGQQKWTPLLELVSRMIHNAYHIGQITKLRESYQTHVANAEALIRSGKP